MKHLALAVAAAFFGLFLPKINGQVAQKSWEFKEKKRIATTPVKNQQRTGTCWSFSATSFLESEIMRWSGAENDLSEMFVVRNIYKMKCENYLRRQGKTQFGEGGLGHDQLEAVRRFGIVPESVFSGKKDPSKPHDHAEMAETLEAMMKNYVEKGQKGQLSDNWSAAVDAVLDAYLGKMPEKFEVNGKPFSPREYAENLGLTARKLDEYVTVTSFSHQPFYQNFPLEVPDNWASGQMLNLPLDEMMQVLNAALDQNLTVEWDADVSNKGFSHKNGLALVPEKNFEDMTDDEKTAVWKSPVREKTVDQAMRQRLFDNLTTQDDHLMHIVGALESGDGGPFFLVKNSWGDGGGNPNKGFVYVSEAYMKLNTISFMVHRSAIPTAILKKTGGTF